MNPRKRKRIKKVLTLRNPDALGRRVKVVVRFDDLRRAKKPPAWMEKLLFSKNASGKEKAG